MEEFGNVVVDDYVGEEFIEGGNVEEGVVYLFENFDWIEGCW